MKQKIIESFNFLEDFETYTLFSAKKFSVKRFQEMEAEKRKQYFSSFTDIEKKCLQDVFKSKLMFIFFKFYETIGADTTSLLFQKKGEVQKAFENNRNWLCFFDLFSEFMPKDYYQDYMDNLTKCFKKHNNLCLDEKNERYGISNLYLYNLL